MNIKKMTQKDRYGNMMSFEFEVPPMDSIPNPDGGHPGQPVGTDTVPAWLTPGEFVMNAEAVRQFKPQIEAMNNQGKAIQQAQGGTVPQGESIPQPQYKNMGGNVQPQFAGNVMAGMGGGLGAMDPMMGGFQPSMMNSMDVMAQPMQSMYRSEGGGVDSSWINDQLLDRLAQVESAGDPNAVSPVGAQGMYQWMPHSAKDPGYGVTGGFDPFNPDVAREKTANYLRGMQTAYPDWSPEQILQAYNWGPGNMQKHIAGEKPDIPQETIDYAMKFKEVLTPEKKQFIKQVEGMEPTQENLVNATQAYANKFNMSPGQAQIELGIGSTPSETPVQSTPPPHGPVGGVPELPNDIPLANLEAQRMGIQDPREILREQIAGRVNEGYVPESDNIETDDPLVPQLGVDQGQGVPMPNSQGIPEQLTLKNVPLTDPSLVKGDLEEIMNDPSQPEERRRGAAAMLQEKYGATLGVSTNKAAESLEGTTGTPAMVTAPGTDVAGGTRVETPEDIAKAKEVVKAIEDKVAAGETITNEEVVELNQNKSIATADTVKTSEQLQQEAVVDAQREPMLESRKAYEEYVKQAERAGIPPMSHEEWVKKNGDGSLEDKPKVDPEEAEKKIQDIVDETEKFLNSEEARKLAEVGPQQVENTGNKAAADDPTLMEKAMSFMEEWGLTDLFDKKEIGRMAALYLGSRILGNSHGGSLNWAAKQYLQRVDGKAAAHDKRVNELLGSGEYTRKSVDKYNKTKDINDLEEVGISYTPTGNTEFRMVPVQGENGKYTMKRMQLREVKGSDGGTYFQNINGERIDPMLTMPHVPENDPNMPEYGAKNQRVSEYLKGTMESKLKLLDGERGFGGKDQPNRPIGFTSDDAAKQFVTFARSMGLDPDSEYVQAMASSALDQAYADAAKGTKATVFTPYLTQMYIREETGTKDHLKTGEDEYGRPYYVEADLVAKLNAQMVAAATKRRQKAGLPEMSPTQIRQTMYNSAMDAWADADQEKWNRMATKGKTTGFYEFMVNNLVDFRTFK